MKWLITRPKITVLFFIMLTIIGAISFSQMPQREIPEFSPPIAQVTTIYPGSSAEEIEQQVTNPIEDALTQYEEIESYESVSAPGLSLITIELDESIDDSAVIWNEINQQVNGLASSFPDDSNTPEFTTTSGDQGLATYHVKYNDDDALPAIQEILDDYAEKVGNAPDLLELDVQGGLDREVLVSLDAALMEDNDLTYEQIIGVLNGEEDLAPVGEWEDDNYIYPVDVSNYSSIDEFNELPVGVNEDGDTILLEDVATMDVSFKAREQAVTYDGDQSLALTFTFGPGSSVPTAQLQLDDIVAELNESLPESAEAELLYTQDDLVSDLFADLALSFAIAVVAVLIVCSLGLRIGSAISVAIAIPVSLSIGSIAIPFFDIGLNQISLIAYIIVLAILVDDGIVVNDNIERQLRNGKSPKEAAYKGTKEVFWSVVTSTIVVVFTFFPILLLPGGAGEFIRPLPVVLISAIIASTVVSLFLIPIYRTWKEKRRKSSVNEKPPGLLGSLFERSGKVYSEKLIRRIVRRPFVVSFIGLGLGTAAFALIPFIPLEFFPDSDREEVFIEATLPDGTPLQETEAYSEEIADWVNEEPFVRSVSTFTGTAIPDLFSSDGGSEESENLANFLIYIDKDMIDARDAMNQWSEELPEAFGDLESYEVSIIESGPPVGAPIAIEIQGESIDALLDKSGEAQEILANTEGVLNVDDDIGTAVESYQMQLDRDVMEENNFSSSEISDALAAIGEGVPLGEFDVDGELLDWRVAYDGNEVDLLDEVTLEGIEESVVLSDIVTIEEAEVTPRIPHSDGNRIVTVRAFPGERSADDIIAEVEDDLLALEDDDTSITIGGETAERTDVFIQIGLIFIVVVFLILIVMAIQFYSLSIPFIILSAVYLAFSGAMIGLFITQTGLGFMSLMGGVSLAGIVVRNGIVLIEFIEQRRKEGLGAKEAVTLAAEQRFRPVVLTSLTTIAGLMPVALGNSTLFQPLGITIVSGALFSAILTLFVVPALYLVRERWKRGEIS
ncbi:efflux RND transporter permease subunit [Geomicrobium sp. JCM 19039]|uniref:efflux RND transporter permease subunit n=1 Tax=Geomicrobium sp. JCM 19039 TaxID=1460636 RepID=UPI000694C5F0|nr:efflux RND transporter permease subunit [Geomicrobium sp. JCM 19039]